MSTLAESPGDVARVGRRLPRRRPASRVDVISSTLGVLFFVSAVGYVGYYGIIAASANADALIEPYLFDDGGPADAILPGNHALFVKWLPIWLQAVVPYDMTSFAILNLANFALTYFLWAVVAFAVLGRRTAVVSLVVLGTFLFGSATFGPSTIELTIRNIEYPLGALFLVSIRGVLRRRPEKWAICGLALTVILFILAAAGDSLVLIVFAVPAGLFVAARALALRRWGVRDSVAIAIVFVAAVGASGVRALATGLGLVELDFGTAFTPQIIEWDHLAASIATATRQTLSLTGADVFGAPIEAGAALAFLNLLFVVVGVGGGILALRKLPFSPRAGRWVREPWGTVAMLSLAALVTFGSYSFSPLVVHETPTGELVDSGVIRYLTFLPFVLSITAAVAVRAVARRRAPGWGMVPAVAVLAAVATVLSLPTVRAIGAGFVQSAQVTRATVEDVIAAADRRGVTLVAGGYWDTTMVRFYSGGDITSVAISDCVSASPVFNARRAWYSEGDHASTALLIDRSGQDSGSWAGCPDDAIIDAFGEPDEVVSIPHRSGAIEWQLWVFDYDVRERIGELP